MWMPSSLMARGAAKGEAASRVAKRPHVLLAAGYESGQPRDTSKGRADAPLPLDFFDERAVLAALGALLCSLSAAAWATRMSSPLPFRIAREILAGGLAAALGEAIFYPVEVAKVRLQAARSPKGGKRRGADATGRGTSLWGELLPLLRGGVLAWAATPGVVAGVVRALIYHGLRLGLFPSVKRALTSLIAVGGGAGGASVSLAAQMLVGATCGALGAALCNPFDLVKARMAAAPSEYPNSVAALAAIARREGGAASLWRGSPATTLRAAMGSGAQLATYDGAKQFIAAQALPRGMPVLLATCASAAAYTAAAAPADVVKTRLMLSRRDASTASASYAGPLDCLRRSVREEGPMVLFRGCGASFARLLPVLLLVFPLLESLRAAFGVGSF